MIKIKNLKKDKQKEGGLKIYDIYRYRIESFIKKRNYELKLKFLIHNFLIEITGLDMILVPMLIGFISIIPMINLELLNNIDIINYITMTWLINSAISLLLMIIVSFVLLIITIIIKLIKSILYIKK